MQNSEQYELCLKILACETANEIRDLIDHSAFFKGGSWLPYGGRSNNSGVITGQMKEPENSLIEKITNSIDAILMRKCLEEGVDPKDQARSPENMEEAINRYFGGREKIRTQRSDIAKQLIRLTATGRKDKPTITVIDNGEGQTPDLIPKTILSLQESIKKKIRFVYGTYNQGGSSALSFCHDSAHPISYVQLVLSRRAQSLAKNEDGQDTDGYGFTIVRARFDNEAGDFTYEYFVDQENKIPRFAQNKPILVDGFDFIEGCLIRLYDYQLNNAGNIVFRGLNESIEKKLSYSPLPMFLQELRNYGGDREYTIFGFREKMERLSQKVLHPGFPADHPVDLGEVGKKAIRVFILQHKSKHEQNIDSYLNQREKVFFIRNGMTLHSENASWLREHCDLTDLAPYMFLFVDISEINPALATMLHSGREEFRNSDATRFTLERLRIYLESFKELDKEYGNLTAADTQIEDKDLRKQLAKEAAKDPELRKLFNMGEDFPTDKAKGETKTPYEGEYLPNKFELIGPDEKLVEKKTYAKIAFRTEAVDDLFMRSMDTGQYDWSDESGNFLVSFSGMNRGILTFRVDPKSNINIGESALIEFVLKIPSKNLTFSKKVKFEIIDTPEYSGEYFPSYFKPVKKNLKIPVGAERKLILSTDVVDDYFTRKVDCGSIKIDIPEILVQESYKLSDGFLIIKFKHNSNKIEKLDDIKLSITDDSGHKFETVTPVEIVPPDYDPNLKLPVLQIMSRENWQNLVPALEIQNIARIPNWSNFDKIYVNTDSIVFEELKQMNISSRDKARDLLIKQIFLNSIWLYLELKDIKAQNGDSSDIKSDAFDRAIRGTRKLILNNIKKLMR